MKLTEIGKKVTKPVKKGWDIRKVRDPYGHVEEMYEVLFNGKVVGDIQNQKSVLDDHPDYAVLHHDSDLSWDMIDTLSDAYEMIKDTHREYMGGKLKESVNQTWRFGGTEIKRIKGHQYQIAHMGNMGNTEKTVAANVDKLMQQPGFFEIIRPYGKHLVDKAGNVHTDASYSYVLLVPAEIFDQARDPETIKESTALSQQYGGKKAKVLSYSQAVRWLARDFPDGGYQGEHFSDYALAIATIYGRDKKEVERDAEHAYNAMRAAGK